MTPMTRPAANALSDETSSPNVTPSLSDKRSNSKSCKKAIDNGGNTGKYFEQRLGNRAEFFVGIFREINGRHQTQRDCNKHGNP